MRFTMRGLLSVISHDTYDLNDTRNQREQRDTVTDYSECLLMGTTLASPLNLLNGFPNRY